MWTSRGFTPVAVAVTLAGLACADRPDPVAPGYARAPAFTAASRPSNPNPRVIRFQDVLSFFNVDESQGLVSAIGLPDDPASSDFFCGGTEPFETLDWQFVLHSSGAVNAKIAGRELNIYLYDVAFVDPSGFVTCDFITSPRLYVGTVRMQYHDNDYFFSQVHTDAFGWTAEGTVTEQATGQRFHVVDRLLAVIHPDGSGSFKSSIRLTALP